MTATSHTAEIQVTGSVYAVVPNILKVYVGDSVQWRINDGSARITFTNPETVIFQGDDTVTPTKPAEGTAQIVGIHEYSVAVWNGSYKSGGVVAVLIIDPRPDGGEQA